MSSLSLEHCDIHDADYFECIACGAQNFVPLQLNCRACSRALTTRELRMHSYDVEGQAVTLQQQIDGESMEHEAREGVGGEEDDDSDWEERESDKDEEDEEQESELVGDVARVRACGAGAKPKRVIAKRAPRPYKQVNRLLLRQKYKSGPSVEKPREAASAVVPRPEDVSAVVASTAGPGVITERKLAEIKERLRIYDKYQDTTDSDVAFSIFRSLLIMGEQSDGKKGDSNGVTYAKYCKALMDAPGGFLSTDEFVMANQERAKAIATRVAAGKNQANRVANNHMCGFRKVAGLLAKHAKGELSVPGWE